MYKAEEYFNLAINVTGCVAAENYIKASREYINNKQYYEAGICYVLAAEIFRLNNLFNQSGINYLNAARTFKDKQNKLCSLEHALENFETCDNYDHKGQTLEKLAKYYAQEEKIYTAINYYEKASKNYKIIHKSSDHIRVLIEAAYLLINNNEYERGLIYLNNIKVKDNKLIMLDKGILIYYLKGVKELDNYIITQEDHMLSKEFNFLYKLKIAFKENDILGHENIINDYHSIYPLSPWKIKLLSQITSRI